MNNAPLALRVKDFCQRIGISPSTFWKFVSIGKIRPIKIGGRTLIPAHEAERIAREGLN
jgi:predicted DNA-binding transcriptional regulator AlpA